MTGIADHRERIEAALLGALSGERAAGAPAAAGDLFEVASSIAEQHGFDDADLRRRGLDRPSQAGAAGLLLRAVAFGLVSPLDRPRMRREAFRTAMLTGADEGSAVAAVAAALLAGDLTRFDAGTAVVRVRQSLLEDAPTALLHRLAVAEPDHLPANDEDAGAALQLAITALDGADGVEAVVGRLTGEGLRASRSLAGALAGARDVLGEAGWREGLPHAARAATLADALAAISAPVAPG
jgi:hypothetical protein